MVRIHDELVLEPPTPPTTAARVRHYPVVYVTDQGRSFVNLLTSISDFIQAPRDTNPKADEILRSLSKQLPSVGTRLVIIDDAHMLRRIGPARDLTDNLKRMLDALPVTFAFVGAGLHQSALLKNSGSADEYSAAAQLARRMTLVNLIQLVGTEHQKAWLRRVRALCREIEKVPGWDWSVFRDPTFLATLHEMSDGETGHTYRLIKDTVWRAVDRNRPPSIDDLIHAQSAAGK